MKKKLLALCAAFTTVVSACSFGGCSKNAETTRMTVDINPSVELMVDADNKVISVTALNDDAAVILQGTALVNKSSEDAVQAVVELATQTGYIVKGEVSASENEVKISVSGDTKQAKELYEDAKKKVDEYFTNSGIQGAVSKADALKTDALKELAEKNSVYSKEEIDAMNDEQLLKVIAIGRIETAELVSEEMREAYFAAKEHKISLASHQATKDVIEQMGSVYSLLYAGFNSAIEAYSGAIDSLDRMRYDTLISPDSNYQKLLSELRAKKAEIIEKKQLIVKAEIGDVSVDITVEKDNLEKLEAAYDELLVRVEAAGAAANQEWSKLISAMEQGEEALRTLQASFPSSINEQLTAKAAETEEKINAAKDGFFASFEDAHAEDIAEMNAALAAAKADLIASVSGGANA